MSAALAVLLASRAFAQLGAPPNKPPQDKYQEAAEFVKLPNSVDADFFRRHGDSYAKAVDLLEDRGVWIDALRAMDGRTGLLNAAIIRVVLKDEDLNAGADLAYVFLPDSAIQVWMPKLVKSLKERCGAGDGRRADCARGYVVSVVAHELTHVYQLEWYPLRMPSWLLEGMASYAADQRWFLNAFSDGRIPALDDRLGGPAAYGRGVLFFMFLEKTRGPDAVRAFIADIIHADTPYPAAAAKIAGPDWAAQEQAWSARYAWTLAHPEPKARAK